LIVNGSPSGVSAVGSKHEISQWRRRLPTRGSHPLADDAGPDQTEYDKAPISETSAPDAQRSNRMDFTIGLNIGDDGKILIHIRIPEDEGFTISEAERFRDLLDKQITVARSMSDGEENKRRLRN
jgi:hypothetical protein